MEVNYEVVYFKQAIKDLDYWKVSGNIKAQKKISDIISALENNPYSEGPGNTEKLKYTEGYSRRINSKDRITYIVYENTRQVVIFGMRGHYEEK